MDFYQGIVTDYLRADRSIFLNTEFCAQRTKDGNPDFDKGAHWHIDAVALNLREKRVYLCEITYSRSQSDLTKKLVAWSLNWPIVLEALERDAHIPKDWPVRPWLFAPEEGLKKLIAKIEKIGFPVAPLVTPLEMTQPWKYKSWDRRGEADKPNYIPVEMRN